jgi:hypothetical protein
MRLEKRGDFTQHIIYYSVFYKYGHISGQFGQYVSQFSHFIGQYWVKIEIQYLINDF